MNFCSFYYICEQRFYARPRRQKDEEFRDAVPLRWHVGPAAGVQPCIRSRGYHRVSRERFPRCLRAAAAFARASGTVCCVPCSQTWRYGDGAGSSSWQCGRSRLRPCEAVARRSCRMRLLRFRLPQHFHQLLATSERPWICISVTARHPRHHGAAVPSPFHPAGHFLLAGPCGRLPLNRNPRQAAVNAAFEKETRNMKF